MKYRIMGLEDFAELISLGSKAHTWMAVANNLHWVNTGRASDQQTFLPSFYQLKHSLDKPALALFLMYTNSMPLKTFLGIGFPNPKYWNVIFMCYMNLRAKNHPEDWIHSKLILTRAFVSMDSIDSINFLPPMLR